MELLVTAALKGTLMVTGALAILPLLRGRSAATRHWVLAGSLLAAAAIPMLQPVMPAIDLGVVAKAAPAPVPDRVRPTLPPIASARTSTTQPFASEPPAPQRRGPSMSVRIGEIAFVVWAAGVALSVGIVAIGFARLRWLARGAVRLQAGPWVDTAAGIAAEYGIRRRVSLLQSRHPSLLVTWGWLRPRIALPIGASRWPEDRIRIVLAHELAHIRRADWLVQLGAELLRSLYWFNPLFWIACRRLRDESERACDDAVLERGVEGPEYAWHLLNIARAFKGIASPHCPAPAIARPSSLEERIGAMIDPRLDRRPMSRRAAAITLCLLLVVTLPVAALQRGRASFEGTILKPGGDPAPNARIVLSQGVGMPAFEQRSDANGRFAFLDLPAGSYRLDVWEHDDARPRMAGLELTMLGSVITLEAGAHVSRDITLDLAPIVVSTNVAVTRTGEQVGPRNLGFPPSWQCLSGLGLNAFCGPPSLLEEFERDFQERGNMPRHVQMPRLTERIVPVYPASLVGSGLEATVTVGGRIGTDGFLTDLRISGGVDPAFIEASRLVAQRMRWEPARVRDVPVEVPVRLDVGFEVRQ